MRYDQLTDELAERECKVLVEIGTWNGYRARDLVRAAFRRNREVTYHGFDLFEDLTPSELDAELSKQPPPRAEVERRLQRLQRQISLSNIVRPLATRSFGFQLHQGFSRDTLPAFREQHPQSVADFVFIDGGHKIETVAGDWNHCSRMLSPGGAIFLDDYYGDESLSRQYGCNTLVAGLKSDPMWNVSVLPVTDSFPDIGSIQIVRVTRAQGNDTEQ